MLKLIEASTTDYSAPIQCLGEAKSRSVRNAISCVFKSLLSRAHTLEHLMKQLDLTYSDCPSALVHFTVSSQLIHCLPYHAHACLLSGRAILWVPLMPRSFSRNFSASKSTVKNGSRSTTLVTCISLELPALASSRLRIISKT